MTFKIIKRSILLHTRSYLVVIYRKLQKYIIKGYLIIKMANNIDLEQVSLGCENTKWLFRKRKRNWIDLIRGWFLKIFVSDSN